MIAREAGWLFHVDQGGDKVWEVFWSSGADWGRCVPGRVHEVGPWLVVVLSGGFGLWVVGAGLWCGFGLWVGGVAHTVGLWCGFAFLSVSSLHSCKGSG